MFIFVLLEFFLSFLRTYFLRAIYIFYIFFGYAGYHVTPFRWFFLLLPRLVTCLLFLLFLSVSSYYLGHCSFSPCFSHSGNWDCTKDFLLIVWTVMLQNHYEGKIVELYIRERLLLKRCIRRRQMPKRYAKYGLFLLSRDYLVVWATMMGNECFMITIYIYTNFPYLNECLFKGRKKEGGSG